MVKPGTNQVVRMPREARNARMRREASAPNSPRDSGVGVVMPRAMKPDCVSKSKREADDVAGHDGLRDMQVCANRHHTGTTG